MKRIVFGLLILVASAIVSADITFTAKGSGYYRVYVDGVEISKHTTEREALERAVNEEQNKPSAVVQIDHDYKVLVEEAGSVALPPPPPPEPPPPPATGALFSDGFESGGLTHTENGIKWGATNTMQGDSVSVSTDRAYSGSRSLKFVYSGRSSGQDGWAEQRMSLGKQYKELWLRWKIFIPANYQHRNDNPDNNKFMTVYSDPYSQDTFANLTVEGGGTALARMSYIYTGPSGYSPNSGHVDFITSADLGKWVDVVMHVKVASLSGANDGAIEAWKNGTRITGSKTLNNYRSAKNYYDELYVLGWANSGFTQTTVFYVDDFEISESNIWGVK